MKKLTRLLFNKIKDDLLPLPSTDSRFDLIVFSHLRWEFVTQRPQHLISRIGKGRKVLFVEEPIPFTDEDRGTAAVLRPTENITVIQPRIGKEDFGAELERIVKYYQVQLHLQNPVIWFYSASFLEMLDRIHGYSAVVYDCMDELSQFKGAPLDLRLKEQRLIEMADLVFTGGKSLYESKKLLKPGSTYCFPSSVDRTHFEQANSKQTLVPGDIASIKRPVVGYYGVIDERVDLQMLGQVAALLPRVSFVMIGPVVKISEADLPRRSNIHYLGAKQYEDLPRYLKGMDIAMMPFALNEATEFISPTKTLEYMAAGKSIISTPINDVVRDYSEVVAVVRTAAQFAKAVTQTLAENAFQKRVRQAKQRVILNKTSWDITAADMTGKIAAIVGKRLSANASRASVAEAPVIVSPSES